jgi:hypothetical protein
MIYKFEILTDKVDSEGDVFKLDGLKIPDKPIVLTRNFDFSDPIGLCKLTHEGNRIKCEAEIDENTLNTYPAISFSVGASFTDENGIRHITDAKIVSASICAYPNADPSIKTIREQTALRDMNPRSPHEQKDGDTQ